MSWFVDNRGILVPAVRVPSPEFRRKLEEIQLKCIPLPVGLPAVPTSGAVNRPETLFDHLQILRARYDRRIPELCELLERRDETLSGNGQRQEKHLYPMLDSGEDRAILGGTGAILACRLAGVSGFRSLKRGQSADGESIEIVPKSRRK